jgi:putative ABC transport system permease protein
MLSPRWRKVLMDIVGNKTRTLLVVLSVAVGVFAVGTISGTQAVFGPGLTDAYVAVNPAHAEISTDPFDDELVQTVANMRGVSAAEGRRGVSVRLKVGPSEVKNLQLVAIPDFRHMTVNIVSPEKGVWPPGPRELLVERSTLDMMNASVGDMITVVVGNGVEKQMRLAGTAHYINAPPGKIGGRPFGFISMETAEWLGASRTYTSLSFTVAEHPEEKEHIQAIASQVRAKVEKSGRTVYYTYIPEPFKHPADQIVQSVLLVLQVLGLLSLFASSFLVVNTISAVLASQVRHIGMMKAVGARSDQIMGMYFTMVIAFGVLALALALPLGALGAYLFTRFLAGLLNFDLLASACRPPSGWRRSRWGWWCRLWPPWRPSSAAPASPC